MTTATKTRECKTNGELTGIRDAAVLQRAFENACRVANTCDEFRGHDVIVLDTSEITSLFDYFVIATGKSRRQLRAMADHSDDVLAEVGSERRSTSGYETEWICHDYGDVVLHVFSPDARVEFDLENLWADAPRVDWKSATIAD
ncbi:ribosome silencing factor [Planctomicrobium sp.]|nr:ribosome silencing factor [bacterium]MDB4439562.1 ribosome silencing factor [Planctomicrobium sp.]MDB4731603.1 ribosome silencing factor [bacterium]